MKIAVCVKQVPNTKDITWTENNTIEREGLESILNPSDALALDFAVKLKNQNQNIETVALTMGPKQAEEVLRYAISLGIDEGILLNDKKFAGSDTLATSRTLASALKNNIKDCDLIITGQIAIDGDTAQTGPSIAQFLDFHLATYVTEILELKENFIIVTKNTNYGEATLKIELPALICVEKTSQMLKKPLIGGYIKAQDATVKTLTAGNLNLNPEQLGLKGSPTKVVEAFRPEKRKRGETIVKSSIDEYVAFLNNKVDELKR